MSAWNDEEVHLGSSDDESGIAQKEARRFLNETIHHETKRCPRALSSACERVCVCDDI